MILTLRRAVLAVVVLAAGGLLFAWSGLFNVAASTGHWPVTAWFLHWVMQNSVGTYAMLTVESPPDLDDPALLPAAAGHYATGCAYCHAAPGEPQGDVANAMTPPPPRLVDWLPHTDWSDKELHRIVEHGVKYSGMPAWPSLLRPDEVWGMVAFLRRMPEMDPATYRTLAYGEGETPPTSANPDFDAALADCARCHGVDGAGRSTVIPVIGGQKQPYLAATLRAYAEGHRASGIMQLAATKTTAPVLDLLAAHYAAARPAAASAPAGEGAPDPEMLAQGEAIATRGVPKRGVPACLACHGVDRPEAAHVPHIEGQHAAYLDRQLHLFREEERGGSPYWKVMAVAVHEIEDDEIAAVAAWFARQPRFGAPGTAAAEPAPEAGG